MRPCNICGRRRMRAKHDTGICVKCKNEQSKSVKIQ